MVVVPGQQLGNIIGMMGEREREKSARDENFLTENHFIINSSRSSTRARKSPESGEAMGVDSKRGYYDDSRYRASGGGGADRDRERDRRDRSRH